MAIDHTKVSPGMNVLDCDGGTQGTVKVVGAQYFQVDRSLAPDVYIRYSDVALVNGDTLTLKISGGHVDDQSWMDGPPAPTIT